uniref:hypothetical protein n=1 Tax=Thiolapillus sp. TaxID=2017437 RepID=UPI003AF932D8
MMGAHSIRGRADFYYSSLSSLLSIADYEEKLLDNLRSLQTRLESDDESWVREDDFLGDWTLVPKSIDPPENDPSKGGLIFSSPAEAWEHACASLGERDGKEKAKAEFRLMAHVSLDFHVLSALWMLKVGCQYDRNLTASSYGNRLRRGEDGEINPLSLGSLKPYLKPFRDWRDNGIQSMRTALEDNKKIVTTHPYQRRAVPKRPFEWRPADCIPDLPWSAGNWKCGNRP